MALMVLIFAHLLADYPLQGDFLAKVKGSNMIALISHAGIWTGTILVSVHLLGYEVTEIDVVTLFIIHAVADYMKAKPVGIYKRLDALKGGLLLDQSLHLLQLLILMTYKGMF
ncbi:hypothetical protein BSK62_13205 [Paenibacillus odorifer]|uniref:DUF3307 domain-containing protein n=1 Tax=Paenibacillus odorifer TaxID=189426 RepID=UPI00096D0FAD|nr:DUF3307 domain-containing protein [Paenibacillus odorifer]OMD66019.1 hypothetical protein BSK62_13205 [Paenibacillus odorifer]